MVSENKEQLNTKCCIIGSGPAAHTAAIYAARAELKPIVFEGDMANGIAAGGQLTTTTDVENFPGFAEGIMGYDLMDRCRAQSVRCGATIYTETVESVDCQVRPFKIVTKTKEVLADTVIISTGAVAKRLQFTGSETYWNKGISACAVCDGAAPIFRKKPLAVIGGGDSAMEEATFLTKFASKVYVVHRRDQLRASRVMQRRCLENPKIEMVWSSVVSEAYGDDKGRLSGIKIKSTVDGSEKDLEVNGLFFAIGHEPATKFLNNQLKLDEAGYIVTQDTKTTVNGIFAAGDVQDSKYRQAVTAAGTGCMAALEAEHYLAELGDKQTPASVQQTPAAAAT